MSAPKLLEIKLPEKTLPGQDLVYPTWSGNTKWPDFWHGQGYDGLHIIGAGQRGTHFKTSNAAPIIIGRHAGVVRLENLTIHAGTWKTIFYGPDSKDAPNKVGVTVILRDCDIVSDDPAFPGRWGLDGYQGDVDAEHCDFWLERLTEHAAYQRGFGDEGYSRVVDCRFHGAGAECWKVVNRPRAQDYPHGHPRHNTGTEDNIWYTPNPSIIVQRNEFKNWATAGWGGGLTPQGTGANMVIEDNVFRGGTGAGKGMCIGITDGNTRHFGHLSDVGGAEPANGNVVMKRNILYGEDTAIMFLGCSPPTLGKQCVRSLTMERNGFYGTGGRVDIHGRTEFPMVMNGNNEPDVNQIAQQMGIPTSSPVRLPR